MSVRRVALVVVVLGLLGTGPRPASACCMVPASWQGDVDQADQHGVVLHHDGHEELILRVAPFFQSAHRTPLAADAPPPPALEWVVTVPTPPTSYGLVPATVFTDVAALAGRLQRLAAEQYEARTRWELATLGVFTLGRTAAAPAAGVWDALDVGPRVRVGPYDITPVKARGREALDTLNRYLAERGFPEEPLDHMAWFVERDFTFLCIHITPPAGAAHLGQRLDLEPLRIGFATDRPYYPAKFSSRQGDFALSLATLTSRPIAQASLGRLRDRLRADASTANLFTVAPPPASLASAVPAGVDRWYVNALTSKGFNPFDDRGQPTISSWTDDVFFDLGGETDEPPGWYYGDRDLFVVERVVREHGIAIAVWGVLGAGIAVTFRRRKARSRSAAGPRVPGTGSTEAGDGPRR